MLKLYLGFLVNTTFYTKQLASKTINIYIRAYILVLVSEFVVVVVLSVWWLVLTIVGTSRLGYFIVVGKRFEYTCKNPPVTYIQMFLDFITIDNM